MENKIDILQLKLMQAIAENKATKSTTRYNLFFWLGIIALALNTVAAILGALFGCPCKENKTCIHWAITAVCIAAILVSFGISIAQSVSAEKEKQKLDKILENKIEQAKAGNETTENLTLAYETDTKSNTQINRRQKYSQITFITIMAVINVLAIIAMIIP